MRLSREKPFVLSRRGALFALGLSVNIRFSGARASVAASIPAQALADYRAGRWQSAANHAGAFQNADNQAFAARALLANALLSAPDADRSNLVAIAKRYADAALVLDPTHIEGRLQLATALGLQARTMSPTRAFARGLPQQVRRLLDAVAREAPNEAWTFALLGGWHLEGLRIGGRAATTMLGTKLADGKAAFARAMRLDGTEASTPFYFAASLLALAPEANKEEARGLLVRAQNCPQRDAFQGAVKARATTLTQTIDTQGPQAGARLALSWL